MDKKLVLAFDADGCIYNKAYRYLVLYIIDKYETKISHAGTKEEIEILSRNIVNDLRSILPQYEQAEKDYSTTLKKSYRDLKIKIEDKLAKLHPMENIDDALEIHVDNLLKKLACWGEWGRHVTKSILFNSNKSAFKIISAYIEREKIDKAYVISASNRLTAALDKRNAKWNYTGLFADDLPLISEILTELTADCDIHHDPFNMGLVYGSHPAFDETKFSFIYALIQHSAKWSNDAFDFFYFDDREDIRNSVTQTFSSHTDLLPGQVNFSAYAYNGILSQAPFTLGGTGKTDYNYRANVRALAALCGWPRGKESIDVANQLDALTIESFTRNRNLIPVSQVTFFHGPKALQPSLSAEMCKNDEIYRSMSCNRRL